MPYQSIDFVSRRKAEQIEGDSNTIVISINDPSFPHARIQDGFLDVLYLEFDNVSSLSGNRVRFYRGHADEILAFVAKHEAAATDILIHCTMGESRSAAVAKFLAEKYSLPLLRPTDKHLEWVHHVLTRVEGRSLQRA